MAGSCHVKNDPVPVTPPTPGTPTKLDTVYNPVVPAAAPSVGFFLDDWQPKSFVAPSSIQGSTTTATATDTIAVDLNKVVAKIPIHLFGNNANQWMGQMADQTQLMQYLTDLNPHVIRFPGGSISDLYFWNSPVNTPPTDAASTLYITYSNSTNSYVAAATNPSTYWYGTHPTSDKWTISLDNYYKVLQQINSAGMITVNYAYARYGKGPTPVQTAAHLAAEWVRYDKGRTKYWEIGNESPGVWEAGYQINTADNLDGQPQIINGALYGKHVKVFADSMRKAAKEVGATIKIGAQVIGNPQASSGLTSSTWNADMFSTMGDYADFFIVHNYYGPWHQNSNATVIFNTAFSETKAISTYLASSASASGIQMKPIAMTEWNIEAEGSKQKVSAVAGMHAVLCVGEMLSNGIGQAARWDLANAWDNGNDHGLFNNSAGSTGSGESSWNPRPAFYYLYFMQKYLGDKMVSASVSPSSSDLTAYASTFASGEPGLIIVNRGTSSRVAQVNINHFNPGKNYYWHTLVPGTDNGEFSSVVAVNNVYPTATVGGPLSYFANKAFSASISSQSFKVAVPARGVVFLSVEKK
jgi:hypothetical protein